MDDSIRTVLHLAQAIISTVYRILTMSYESAITIILTALAVMLAVLGLLFVLVTVVLAVLAIFGYRDLGRIITEAATKEVLKRVPFEQALKAEMRIQIGSIFKDLTAPVVAEIKNEANLSVDASNSEVGSIGLEPSPAAPVSEPYPGEEVNHEHDEQHSGSSEPPKSSPR